MSKPPQDRGEVLRVSRAVYDYIQGQRAKNPRKWKRSKKSPEVTESVDSTLRRLFNMSDRRGNPPKRFEAYALKSTGKLYATLARARGASIEAHVSTNDLAPERPIKVREVT